MKKTVFLLVALTASVSFALPQAENVTFAQGDDKVVTITYTLTETPAIVTLDIQTNVTGDVWASIGTDRIVPGLSSGSEANRKVTGTGPHEIKWRPGRSWPAETAADNLPAGSVRAVVTAWSLDNPPDYMVVDVSPSAEVGNARYYPDAESVPGGVLGNEAYRKTALLMRKIPAKDVSFAMGSVGEYGRSTNETSRTVTFDSDFYMAVFETTQEQWRQVTGAWPVAESKSNRGSFTFTNELYRAMRPAQNVSYNEIRTSGSYNTYNKANDFPNPPHGSSFLGILRMRTGFDFDLPGEAQWEFACRAGNGEGYWNDGKLYESSTMPGRNSENGGNTSDYSCGPESGTAICGSYAPNDYGLYDMLGNIGELCLDWFQTIVPSTLGHHVNVDPTNPYYTYDKSELGAKKTKRGGCYTYSYASCRSAARNSEVPSAQYLNFGCRVVCPLETR